MPKYRIKSPDGKEFEVNAPEGASQAEVLAYAQSQWKAKDTPEETAGTKAKDAIQAVSSGVNRGVLSRAGLPFNPVDAMANVIDLGKYGVSALRDPLGVLGLQNPKPSVDWLAPTPRSQVVGSGEYLVNKGRSTEMGRAMLDPNKPQDEGGYLQAIGQGMGSGGRSAPITGALSAVAQKATYDATGNEALAIAAGMSPTAAKMAIKAGVKAMAAPSDKRVAGLAETAIDKYGIPLNTADVTDSRFIKAARSVMNDTPGLATIGAKQDAGKQPAFNRAVGRTFGADAEELTPQVMSAAKGNMGSKFDRIWNGNNLEVDGPLMQKLMDLRNNAAQLPSGDRARLNGWVDDVLGQMRPNAQGTPIIPGEVANKYQSRLRALVDSAPEGFVKNDLADLRQSLIGGFNRSITGPEAKDLADVRRQYKAFKTVEPLLNKGEAGVAGRMSGDVPASLLSSAVAKAYDNPAGTDLGELSRIGSKFLVDRTPQTGGSARAMVQNSILGGSLLTGLGVASPAAAVGGAASAGLLQLAIGNPRLARELLRSGQLTPDQIKVLANVPGLLSEDKTKE